jgi:hypothetical protein
MVYQIKWLFFYFTNIPLELKEALRPVLDEGPGLSTK